MRDLNPERVFIVLRGGLGFGLVLVGLGLGFDLVVFDLVVVVDFFFAVVILMVFEGSGLPP